MMSFDSPAYDGHQLKQLFENILVDDVISPDARYPEGYVPAYPQSMPSEAYRLCWQLVDKGVVRSEFRRLVRQIAVGGGTEDPRVRLAFKYARARYKHLRFACALFDRRHRYPWALNLVTSMMGHMQDAFKNHQGFRTRLYGALLYGLLCMPFYAVVKAQLDCFEPSDLAELNGYFAQENATIAALINKPTITGREFHDLRKIVSRRVAFNDTVRVLYPDSALDAVSRCLATINGEMGDRHDVLVEKRIRGTQDYTRFAFELEPSLRNALSDISLRR